MNKNKFESKIKVCVTITNGGSDYYVNVANNDDTKHYVCIRNQYKVQILKEYTCMKQSKNKNRNLLIVASHINIYYYK